MDVLITGTTHGGIGFETAKALLLKGHRVFIVCRTPEKTDETYDLLRAFGRCEKAGEALELEDLRSVHNFVKQFRQESLNCLINNAGIMAVPELRRTKQDLEKHVGVNFVAPYMLTRMLLRKLIQGARKSGVPSRIINVSSDAHFWGDVEATANQSMHGLEPYNANKQYGTSKLFQMYDTADLNQRFASQDSNSLVVSLVLHPGVVQTNLAREIPKRQWDNLKKESGWVFLTPEQGAQTTILCATASLEELQCVPPLKTLEAQIPYYKDVKRAPNVSAKLVLRQDKVDETITAVNGFLNVRSFL